LKLFDQARSLQRSVGDRDAATAAEPALGRAISAAVGRLVSAASGWQNACEGAFGGSNPLAGASMAFKNLGKQLSAMPLQPALTRSGRQTVNLTVHPGDLKASLRAEADGTVLRVHATLESEPAESKELSLYIVEAGGGWAWIGSAHTQGGEWSLVAHNVFEMLGIDPDELNAQWFALAEGRMLPRRNTVALSTGSAEPVRLGVVELPRVSDGLFTVTIEWPARIAESHPGSNLELALELGPIRYPIGFWPVSSLGNGPSLQLSAPIPDLNAEGELEYLPGLSLRLTQ
jgi:hypothetical protein